jgi:hypothetical protein
MARSRKVFAFEQPAPAHPSFTASAGFSEKMESMNFLRFGAWFEAMLVCEMFFSDDYTMSQRACLNGDAGDRRMHL